MSDSERESDVLATLVPRLEADGYTVYINPPLEMLPPFLKSYRPDAIALGKPTNLAIEIVYSGPTSGRRVEQLRKLFEGAQGWKLQLHYVLLAGQEDPPPK